MCATAVSFWLRNLECGVGEMPSELEELEELGDGY